MKLLPGVWGWPSVSEAYRHFARHPKAARNQHWRAKVRQKLQLVAERVGPGVYAAREAVA